LSDTDVEQGLHVLPVKRLLALLRKSGRNCCEVEGGTLTLRNARDLIVALFATLSPPQGRRNNKLDAVYKRSGVVRYPATERSVVVEGPAIGHCQIASRWFALDVRRAIARTEGRMLLPPPRAPRSMIVRRCDGFLL